LRLLAGRTEGLGSTRRLPEAWLGLRQRNIEPATDTYGIADSPVGLAFWILDHDIRSYRLITRIFDGQSEGLTRDDILDNVTLYWLTNAAISSARLYWDTAQISKGGGFFDVRDVKIPVAVSAFPDEIYQAPKSWAEKAYPKLIHYNRPPKGGHFAAWEQPALFVPEMRASFRSMRV
jgi:pimeloyl-ACP methyl ester carboxylesterase